MIHQVTPMKRRKRPEYWDMDMGDLTFKKAQREVREVGIQGKLF
jgi:hypothetical protein